jgi:competence protein ComEC
VGVLANLIAIPWVTAWVLPLALFGTAWPALWGLAAASVQALGAVLQMLAAWPGGVLVLPAAPQPIVAAALLGAALLVLRLPPQLRLAGLPLVLPWLLWQPPAPAPGSFDLLGVDVGQGQAVLVRTARHALLYDAGPRWGEESDAGAQVLVPLLRSQGVTLDLLVISHSDSDHAGGAAAVLSDQRRAGLLASLPPGHALAAHRPPQVCLAGQRWSWDGVQLEVLHPQEADLEAGRPNAHSCVLRVVAANGAAALLAGDLEAPQEGRLMRRLPRPVDAGAGRPQLQADLLLVPHHGSRTSSSDAWLDAVRPRLALVQAGYRNRYGHPAPDVMARYAQRGIPVALTAGCGAAFWSSEAPGVLRCQRALAPRYWQHQAPAWAGAAPAGEPEADQTETP